MAESPRPRAHRPPRSPTMTDPSDDVTRRASNERFRRGREELAAALAGGAEQVHHLPPNPPPGIEPSILDLRELGPGRVFGRWDRAAPAWCPGAFDAAASGRVE